MIKKSLSYLVLAIVAGAMIVGCKSEAPAERPSADATLATANKFLDTLEAQPPASRRQYVKDHASEVMNLPFSNPEVKARLDKLVGKSP